MRSLIVSIHMLLVVAMYWVWRDFPRDQSWPELLGYLLDAWSILGGIAAIAILINKRLPGWVSFFFYLFMTLRFAAILFFMGKYGISQRLGPSADLTSLVLLLLIPFLQLFVPKKAPAREFVEPSARIL